MALPRTLPTTNQSETRTGGDSWAPDEDLTSHRPPPSDDTWASEPQISPATEPPARRRGRLTFLLLILASLPFLLPHLNALRTSAAPPLLRTENSPSPPPNALRAAWRDIHRPSEVLPGHQRTLAPVTSVLEDMGSPSASAPPAKSRETPADPPPSSAALLAERMVTPAPSAASERPSQPSPPIESATSTATDPTRSEAPVTSRDNERVTRDQPGSPEVGSGGRPNSAWEAEAGARAIPSREPRSFDARSFDDREIERLPRGRVSAEPFASTLTRAQQLGKGPRARLKPARRTAAPALRPQAPDAATSQGMSLFQGLGRVNP
jgi:hypothetical protein